jgi:hypothetical protein
MHLLLTSVPPVHLKQRQNEQEGRNEEMHGLQDGARKNEE